MPQKLKRKIAKYYFILRPITALFFGGLLLFLIVKGTPFIYSQIKPLFSPLSIGWQIIFGQGVNLKKADHRINILLLGISGGNHDGPTLTDTMIFTSIDVQKKDVLMISIPRDIWIDSMKAKINTAFYYGEQKKPGGGFTLSKAAVTEILDQPVDYTVMINFNAFKKAVDLLGGIDVNVERSFVDNKYPIDGKENDNCGGDDPEFKCRYETIKFNKGLQHLDGATALIFVRSRYAIGDEGTDFARSKRQQKVILSIKDKLFSLSTLLNPTKIKALMNTFGENIASDIQSNEIDDFVRLAKVFKNVKIRSFTLDEGDETNKKPGLLMNPPVEDYEGNWVLAPRSGDWTNIQQAIKTGLNN